MGLIEELAEKPCERVTTRNGCIGDVSVEAGMYDLCTPCKARVELGRPPESPRHCERCGKRIVRAVLSKDRKSIEGFDDGGNTHCAEPPSHSFRRYYDEYPSVGRK